MLRHCFTLRCAAASAAAATAASASSSTVVAPPAAGLRKVRVKARPQGDPALAKLQAKVSQQFVDGDCSSTAPAEKRPLSALQRRMLAMQEKTVFSLSPNAVYRIKVLMDRNNTAAAAKNSAGGGDDKKQPLAVGVRIGVQKRGCSGYSYTVNYAFDTDLEAIAKAKADLEKKYGKGAPLPIDSVDSHVEQSGVHVIVDAGALFYVIGTKMDYIVSDVEEKFEFANPNKKSTCGCGDSFMPDM